MNSSIIFEQPLAEYVRICLRLEQLFCQIRSSYLEDSPWASRTTLNNLLQALHVIERPDLKTKLTRALANHAKLLTLLENHPGIDAMRLKQLLNRMDYLTDTLYQNTTKLGQHLSDNDFLKQIRMHLYNPGGLCHFNVPALQRWLSEPPKQRHADLKLWLKEFELLEEVSALLLNLIRERATLSPQHAPHGFFQQTLNPQHPCELIRLRLPEHCSVYPEISAGRHRLCVRFMKPHYHDTKRALQAQEDQAFELACCIVPLKN